MYTRSQDRDITCINSQEYNMSQDYWNGCWILRSSVILSQNISNGNVCSTRYLTTGPYDSTFSSSQAHHGIRAYEEVHRDCLSHRWYYDSNDTGCCRTTGKFVQTTPVVLIAHMICCFFVVTQSVYNLSSLGPSKTCEQYNMCSYIYTKQHRFIGHRQTTYTFIHKHTHKH